MSVLEAPSELLFEERLRPAARGWLWLPPILAITFLAIAPVVVPIALLAWFVNIARFWRTTVRIDPDYVWVGKRSARLAALDLTTLGRAQNTWPWRTFSRRWLGANPIWAADSVGVRGFDGGKPFWVSVGTNRRDALVAALERAVPDARARTPVAVTGMSVPPLAPPGWHPDPWDPAGRSRAASTADSAGGDARGADQSGRSRAASTADSAGGAARGADQLGRLRWWDGWQWTGWTHEQPRGPSGVGGSGP